MTAVKGEKRWYIKTYYSDGSFAGTLTQDDFVDDPQFTIDLNGSISEIRLRSTFDFNDWNIPPDGILTENTGLQPPDGYTGATIQTIASGKWHQYNSTYFGNICYLYVVEGFTETLIWTGIYAGINVVFNEGGEKENIHTFIPTSARLNSRIFRSGTLTSFTLTEDPAQMARDIIDSIPDVGLSYTDDSIDTLGVSRSYDFTVKTCQEAIDAVLSLCSSDWYYYIGGDNIFYLKNGLDVTTHYVSFQSVKSFSGEKNLGLMRNRVLFLGGSSVFRQVDALQSQALLGIFEERVSDNGLTTDADVTNAARNILNKGQLWQTSMTVEIMDDNFTNGGYDIESIKPGDKLIVSTDYLDFANIYWGSMTWGVDSWLFDAYAFTGLAATIKRITYKFDSIVCECSFSYQNLAQLIGQTESELKALQFVDAPTEPT